MPHIPFVNHIGFLVNAEKKLILPDGPWKKFQVQDMSKVVQEHLGEYENWEAVFEGDLTPGQTPMGTFLTGNFSELTKPGIYRVVIPEGPFHSYQFTISDGIFHPMVRLFLDFVHNWRSGDFSNHWRGPSHLDDGIRSDTGAHHDVSGGWYDAGDTRKWMTMSTLPVLAFLDIHQELGIRWNHFSEEGITGNDLLTEAAWGLRFILKMQDAETGMIFEEVGAGGDARKQPGMSWWYENHSGCLADNSENRFTDNLPKSGDERTIRVSYNPVVQYTNLFILLRAAEGIKGALPKLSRNCLTSAEAVWRFVCKQAGKDPMHDWTVVRAWRLMAGRCLVKAGLSNQGELGQMIKDLLNNHSDKTGFWCMDKNCRDPYRGVLHSAQPLIALANVLLDHPDHPLSPSITKVMKICREKYILPMSSTNPFGIMPYGLYHEKKTNKDLYRKFGKHGFFRFFMPENSPQRINHGLGGHWTSWAHALALMGRVMDDQHLTDLAWNQLYWLWGNNPLNVCLVSGMGYNNPMPHSRFLGTFPGGFCVGPRGSLEDQPVIDTEARAEWSSTEYWLTPLSNALMALAILLPRKITDHHKLGSE